MPNYWARCLQCDKTFEYFSTISDRNTPENCECGGSTQRDVQTELHRKNVNLAYKENPRPMRSMAVLEEDFQDAKRLHPQAEWKKMGNSWVPIVKNRTERQQLLRQVNSVSPSFKYD